MRMACLGGGSHLVLSSSNSNPQIHSSFSFSLLSLSLPNQPLKAAAASPTPRTLNLRCLYSPLVETFETPKNGPPRISISDYPSLKVDTLGSLVQSSPNKSINCERDDCIVEDLYNGGASKDHQDPAPGTTKENSNYKAQATRSNMNVRGRTRSRSRSFTPHLAGTQGGMHLYTVGVVGPPIARTGKVSGPLAVCMTLVVATLAISTAATKRLFPSTDNFHEPCRKCNGYGVEVCELCHGRGRIRWEGKLRRDDPCPSCIGNCVKKCSTCGGVHSRKGNSLKA